MARQRKFEKPEKETVKQNLHDIVDETTARTRELYDMFRAKAADMGHKAANLPDSVYNKYIDTHNKNITLNKAKLYIQNYMMGNLDPQEFAYVMAEDDKLRYTISDLCKMKLEPVIPDIQRNNKYVDIGAGLKTFWTEMRVPLPSEINTARDLINLSYGIEAGRATAGVKNIDVKNADIKDTNEDIKAGKRTLSDRINDIKKRIDDKRIEYAEKTIEKLTADKDKLDESWLETPEGIKYKEAYLNKGAEQIHRIAEGLDKRIDEKRGINKDAEHNADEQQLSDEHKLRSGYTEEELNAPVDSNIKDILDQITAHVNHQDVRNINKNDVQQQNEAGQNKDYNKNNKVYMTLDDDFVSMKASWMNHKFTDEELSSLAKGETISIEYTDENNEQKTTCGRLVRYERNGEKCAKFVIDHGKTPEQKIDDVQPEAKSDTKSDELFTAEDEALMNYSMDNDQSEDDYYAHLAEDMENYQSEDVILSEEDVDSIQPDNAAQLSLG